MGDVRKKFMRPLMVVFAPPRSDGEQEWLLTYVEMLGCFTDEVLSEAAKRIIATRETRSMPLPSECIAMCRQVSDMLERTQRIAELPRRKVVANSEPIPTQHAIAQANMMLDCELGRRAVREDWVLSLRDFCVKNGRLPDRHEAELVKSDAMAIEADLRSLIDISAIRSIVADRNNKKARIAKFALGRLEQV